MVFHYASDVGKLSPASTKDLHISVAETILNKEAGWKALTGTTDFGTIATSSDPTHQLAFNLFVDRICGFVGSYYVALRGDVDALVFAGGIGEKSDRLRRVVVEQCSCLGFAIDHARNESQDDDETARTVREVGMGRAREGKGEAGDTGQTTTHRVLVVQTDEQFEMARAAAEDSALWADDGDDLPDLTLLKVKSGHT